MFLDLLNYMYIKFVRYCQMPPDAFASTKQLI